MCLTIRCLLTGCLIVCLAACASNNSGTPQNGSVAPAASSNSTVGQSTIAGQPKEGSGDATGADTGAPAANQPPPPAGIDACSLLTATEVAAIQGGTIKDTKGNQRSEGDFLMSQCFYTAEEFVRSVSLSVVQQNPAATTKQPREYFNEKFSEAVKKPKPDGKKEREAKKENQQGQARGEEEEKKDEPTVERVGGLGEQAYWVQGGPSAALYVLKKNQFIILSLGGGDADAVKLKKTKELAQKALKRLK